MATRELQLERLVAECNEKEEQRKIARARGRESTITREELDMEHVVEELRVMEIALPEGTLEALSAWETPHKTRKASCQPPSAGIELSKGTFAQFRELSVFAPTPDDDPIRSPLAGDRIDHFDKWFRRVAVSLEDGKEIKERWESHAAKRTVIETKDLPSPRAQAKSKLPQPASPAPPAANPVLGEIAAQATTTEAAVEPAAAPTEGSSSASAPTTSNEDPGTAKQGPHKKASKTASKTADSKRRRVQSCPPPNMLVAPAEPVLSDGNSQANRQRLAEWDTYLKAVVKQDPVLTESDAKGILDAFIAACQEAQDRLDDQAKTAAAFFQQTRIEAAAAAATAVPGATAAATAARIEGSVLKHNKGKEADPKSKPRASCPVRAA